MATWVYPPLAPDQLKLKEEESLARELQWLLMSLQDSLVSLKEGLEECVALLAPKEPGSTLVLSSLRSESVKGFVTRVGTKIVKGDLTLRLSSLAPNIPRGTPTYPSTRYTLHPPTPDSPVPELSLPPLLHLAGHLNASLDLIDITRWTGHSTSAPFIASQLHLLSSHLTSARHCLQGSSSPSSRSQAAADSEADEGAVGAEDWFSSSSSSAARTAPCRRLFRPPLHPNLSLHFTVQDASLVLTVRTLLPVNAAAAATTAESRAASGENVESALSSSGFNLRDRLFSLAVGGVGGGGGIGGGGSHGKTHAHDEMGMVFPWRRDSAVSSSSGGGSGGSGGGEELIQVQVKEKIRVESADPSLMSVAAKLSALDHEVRRLRAGLAVLMGEDGED